MAAEVRPIRTKQDYEAALKEVERLWGAKSGTRDGDRLDVLATLIDAYEAEHYPIADTANSTDCVPFVLADSNKSDRRSARMSTEHLKMDGCWSHSTREIALWLAVSCILLAAIGFSWNPTPFAHVLAVIFIACALVHAGFFYGSKPALILFVICIAISFTMENIGAATGFPFGHYHFEFDAGLPRVGSTPIIVGPLWFGAGYFSWIVASILLDSADRRLGRPFNVIALPVVAAFVMTQWDLVMDRSESTLAKVWIWHDGGADFGVPLSNYLGWLLTSWLFFQVFAFYLRRVDTPLRSARQTRKLQLSPFSFT